ncbi:hypothetical protein SAMN05443575_2812 [Jatrophihabitans endophyticus]|uniref:Secreted protein n=1 Tax=Jatrophihabitans endophyticus TaxID=1206085 RepID=A0A1M5MTP2_9ACTN|nr:hypothetical protein [Jatrophihabitans endophyticus]SHG80153.1 hypothetical protein SAMN05443575_2812 [Jatrophihabitans endophyticus]
MRRLLLLLLTCALLPLTAVTAVASAGPPRPALDGLRIGYLPAGVGASTDFAYDYDDVGFVSRVWESRTTTGWRFDLTVDVLRGDRLSTPRRLHDWLVDYQDRPAGEARYVPTHVHGRPGWVSGDEVFWLVRPGLAVLVRLDTARWPHRELLRVARAVNDVSS